MKDLEKLTDHKFVKKINAAKNLALDWEDFKAFDLMQKEKKNDK